MRPAHAWQRAIVLLRTGRTVGEAGLTLMVRVALFNILVLALCAGSRAQEPVVSQALDPLRIVTELEPAIRTIEVRGLYGTRESGKGGVRFHFRYQAPDEYVLLLAINDAETATVMAASGNNGVFYDATQGSIVLMKEAILNLHIAVDNQMVTVKWGINPAADAPPGPRLMIDYPAILRLPSIQGRTVERLGDGRSRLILTFAKGNRMVFTTDTGSPIQFTDFLMEIDGHPWISWTVQVNHEMSPLSPPFPSADRLRRHFTVQETTPPYSMPQMMRLLGLQFILLFASSPDDRKFAEQFTDEKLDWGAIEAALKRDLPKLRQLFPLP